MAIKVSVILRISPASQHSRFPLPPPEFVLLRESYGHTLVRYYYDLILLFKYPICRGIPKKNIDPALLMRLNFEWYECRMIEF
jgi:hypothetical protein